MHTSPIPAAHVKFDESKRVVAKLMARENITVLVNQQAKTALFDLKTRTLHIPNWKLALDQCDMLLAHEVGHALFTNPDQYKAAHDAPDGTRMKGVGHYLNVLEDVRIERKIQQLYPGLAGVFRRAYRLFHEQGPLFRGTRRVLFDDDGKATPIKRMRLIDRINVHAKLGPLVDVPFRPDERVFLARVHKAETLAEIVVLAHELYAHDKAEWDRKMAERQARKDAASQPVADAGNNTAEETAPPHKDTDTDDGEEDDTLPEDTDDDDEDEDAPFDPEDVQDEYTIDDVDPVTPEATDTEPTTGDVTEPTDFDPTFNTTDKALQNAVDQSAMMPPMVAVRPLTAEMVRHHVLDIMTYHQRLATWAACDSTRMTPKDMQPVLKYWQDEHTSLVQHMVQEFIRRRAGKVDVRAHMAKTGRLDMGKLAQYQFTDDLFRQIRVMPTGQNHGVVMLLDASDSMKKSMTHVVEQVMLFAHFAQKANIPFRALMFVGANPLGYSTRPTSAEAFAETVRTFPPMTLYPGNIDHVLVTVVDTTSRAVSFTQQMLILAALWLRFGADDHHPELRLLPGIVDMVGKSLDIPYGTLGGTPLLQSLLLIEQVVADLKARLRLDRTTLLVLSDGDDSSRVAYASEDGTTVEHLGSSSACILRDAVTKRVYPLYTQYSDYYAGIPHTIVRALYDIITTRHGTRVVHMHLVDNTERTKSRYILLGPEASWPAQATYRTALEQGQCVIPEGVGVAPMTVVVLRDHMRTATSESHTYPGKSVDATLHDFKKHAVDAAKRRKLVNVLMPHVA